MFLFDSKIPIPITEDIDLAAMLTDDAVIAGWNNEGLPSDRMSTENAAIFTNCERWPLLIDPQLQGIKWIKNKYGTDLKITHLGQKGYVQILKMHLHIVCINCNMICINANMIHFPVHLRMFLTQKCQS